VEELSIAVVQSAPAPAPAPAPSEGILDQEKLEGRQSECSSRPYMVWRAASKGCMPRFGKESFRRPPTSLVAVVVAVGVA